MKLKPVAQVFEGRKLTDPHRVACILAAGLLLPDETLLCSLPEAEAIITKLELEIERLRSSVGEH